MNKYIATDRMHYNGAPCSDLQRELNTSKELEHRMKLADPTSSCIYFPMEGKYLVFTNSNILENPDLKGLPEILTGNFHQYKQDALIEAIQILDEVQTVSKLVMLHLCNTGLEFRDNLTAKEIVRHILYAWDGVRNIKPEDVEWVCEHIFNKSFDRDAYVKTFTLHDTVDIVIKVWEGSKDPRGNQL